MDRSDAPDVLFLQDGDEVLCLVPFELDPDLSSLDGSC